MVTSIFSIPRFLMNDFMATWTEELKLNIQTGYPASEEQILACVKGKEPQLFNCYQAEHPDIIANRFGLRTKYQIIIENLQYCNLMSFHRGIAEVGPALLDLITPDDNSYTIDQILIIYNEILIGCWYLDDKRHISRDAAVRMEKLLSISTLPENIKQNMTTNIGFHDIKLE